jgi:hypothetical protein
MKSRAGKELELDIAPEDTNETHAFGYSNYVLLR